MIGFVGRPWPRWSPSVPIRDTAESVAVAGPGFVKGAMAPTARTTDRGVALGTGTGVLATEPVSRRAFGRDRRVVHRGRAAIWQGWLCAVKGRGNERGGAPCAQ